MSHFSQDFLHFFEELAGDNSKEWFDEHRERYHRVIKDPWYAFVQDVIDAAAKRDDRIAIAPKHAVFRIHRDTRFSKNKQPYKLHVAACISPLGRQDMNFPGLYIQAGHAGVHIGCGVWRPDKQQLQQIRAGIVRERPRVQRLLDGRTSLRKYFGGIQGEKNKILPKEFKPVVQDMPLIANKQYFFYTTYASKIMLQDDLLTLVMRHRDAASDRNCFLQECLELAGVI